jgi:hypothetical protein
VQKGCLISNSFSLAFRKSDVDILTSDSLEKEQSGVRIHDTLGRQHEQIVNARDTVRSFSLCSFRVEGLMGGWWIIELGGFVNRTRKWDAEGHDPEVRRFYCLSCSFRRRSANQVVVNVCRMYSVPTPSRSYLSFDAALVQSRH